MVQNNQKLLQLYRFKVKRIEIAHRFRDVEVDGFELEDDGFSGDF